MGRPRVVISLITAALASAALAQSTEPLTPEKSQPPATSTPQPPAATPSPAAQPPDAAQANPDQAADLATLLHESAGLIARKAAAARLISATDPTVRAALAELITRSGNGSAPASPPPTAPPANGTIPAPTPPARDPARESAREYLLAAIAGSPSAPDWLAAPMLDAAARSAPRPPSLGMIAALGSVRTQPAVRRLLDTASTAPAEARAAALVALRRLTGRDLGDDPRAWAAWFAGVEFLGEPDWRRVLWEGLAQRADALAGASEVATARLVDIKRREFLALPEAGPARSQLLASLLADELAPLRRLGVDLVRRELANGRVPDEFVVDSTVELLGSTDPEFRGAAAGLLAALAPSAAGDIVSEALLRETSPQAAGAMLLAASRWPRASIVSTVLAWLEGDPVARTGAVEAAAALHRAGLLSDPALQQRVAAVLRAVPPAETSDTAAWLLAQVGSPADRAYLVSWLEQPVAALRTRAAEALTSLPEGVAPILAAAESDPALFESACRAVARTGPTPTHLNALARLKAPSAEVRERGLILAASAGAAPDAIAFAQGAEPPALREALLASLVLMRPWPEPDAAQRAALIQGALALARTRLALGQPARALDAIDAAGTWTPSPPQAAIATRVAALAWLNRLDDALALRAGPDGWLDGLEFGIDLPHARDIAEIITHRFPASDLSAAQQARLAALVERMAHRVER